jgi:hypothetical protein
MCHMVADYPDFYQPQKEFLLTHLLLLSLFSGDVIATTDHLMGLYCNTA